MLPIQTLALLITAAGQPNERAVFLSWTERQALEIGNAMRVDGRVGGWLDTRVIHTEHSYNYKLRATWLTPEVIRASARMHQLLEGMDDEQAKELVEDAEGRGDTVILVEIDPREGSGIIPLDWVGMLRPTTDQGNGPEVRGVDQPVLRTVKALSGTSGRDYAYDVFWLVFPLVDSKGEPLFQDSDKKAELVVRIRGKEGRVSWVIPGSIRDRSRDIASRRRPTQ